MALTLDLQELIKALICWTSSLTALAFYAVACSPPSAVVHLHQGGLSVFIRI